MNTTTGQIYAVLLAISGLIFVGWEIATWSKVPATCQKTAPVIDEKPTQNHGNQIDKRTHTGSQATQRLDKPVRSRTGNRPVISSRSDEIAGAFSGDDEFIDDNWEEEIELAEQQTLQEPLTDEERAQKEAVYSLENRLMKESYDDVHDQQIYSQVDAFFTTEDEDTVSVNSLLDLQCANGICRMTVKITDEESQYALVDDLSYTMDWLEDIHTEVTIQPDDSRMAIIYLTSANMED